MEDWNDEQQSVMKQFKNKEICLSDDSCSDSDDENKLPKIKMSKNQRMGSNSPPVQRIQRKMSANSIDSD